MLSYTGRRNLYGKLTNDSSSDNLSYGDTLINEAEKRIMNKGSWAFIQRTQTQDTVADQQFYDLPFNYRKLIGNPTITVGTTTYVPEEIPDRATWDLLNSTSNSSDTPSFFFIFDNQVGFYPTPSTSSNTITLPYEIQQRDLSVADYTTGTITTVATTAGVTTITAGSATWTSPMVGRFIRIDANDTATSGDNEWYEIATIPTSNTATLTRVYGGTEFTGATTTYTIGQMSIIPNGYDNLPIYKATEQYYIENGIQDKADRFKRLYDELFEDLVSDRGSKTSSLVVNRPNRNVENPNYFPSSLS